MTTTPTASGLSQWKQAQRERDNRKAKEKARATAKAQGKPVYTGCPDGRPHHYIFETPNGPTVTGICKYCEKVKVSPTFEEIGWDFGATVTEAY